MTVPEHLARWWGPKGYTTPACRTDLRVGGRFHLCMRSPEGQDMWITGTYREVAPPHRLVYTDSFADEQGNVISATHYGMPESIPLEMLVSMTFENEAGKTRMTLVHSGLPAGEMADGAVEGWNESLDRMVVVLAEMAR
jgi:uncharacterized protein YndB with AHSA1/START domain